MNIAMFTNTFTPQVGGVAGSVERFSAGYRRRGHEVLVVAPRYDDLPARERGVLRVPSLPHFNGSDFSMVLPIKPSLDEALEAFDPDILHAHHPYILGDTALREAAALDLPLVFTHHTMYEHYTHYMPLSSPMRGFIIELATGFANFCDHVIAPSNSLKRVLRQRGVRSSISVIPTGVDLDRFADGNGRRMREQHGLPEEAFVVGHVGRLGPEKNPLFLCDSVAKFLKHAPDARFLVVGDGPSAPAMRERLDKRGVTEQVVFTGILRGQDLVDAYHAMDVFAFTSLTETQGMVLVEALSTGCPVVALNAPGAREVVRDGKNGRLLRTDDAGEFSDGLRWCKRQPRERLRLKARRSAQPFAEQRCADRALALYENVLRRERKRFNIETSGWRQLQRQIETEWHLWANRARALGEAFGADSHQHRHSA